MTPLPDNKLVEVKALLFRGDKIGAIKLYRLYTGLGLAESKGVVDQLESELRGIVPDKFTKPASKGCMSTALVCGSLLGALIYWVK